MSARTRSYFGRGHPVAAVAARACRERHAAVWRTGGVACGECWEQAIRADERVIVLFGLPREQGPDSVIVDAVAVERACAGERVRLTARERGVAARELAARGLPVSVIAKRLRTSDAWVRELVTPLVVADPVSTAAVSTAAPVADVLGRAA